MLHSGIIKRRPSGSVSSHDADSTVMTYGRAMHTDDVGMQVRTYGNGVGISHIVLDSVCAGGAGATSDSNKPHITAFLLDHQPSNMLILNGVGLNQSFAPDFRWLNGCTVGTASRACPSDRGFWSALAPAAPDFLSWGITTIAGFARATPSLQNAAAEAAQFLLHLKASVPRPLIWSDDASEIVFEWMLGDRHAVVSFEGDGEFGYAMKIGGRFVPGRHRGNPNGPTPVDLANYIA
ncbi:hypothetical protein [Tardiphaga sp. 709]|uniref:hypothetical protein n=1 Tax=Tardiphaga sp. 709 TaxID=3076039 RepID=UPI0028E372C6|nr:hypothetical protein [Tardiphaga sp. 709]WNV09597.1 hypothetical protein RSO67_29815 [Tardiphaga sp. 709]